tara:strand:- start:68 stop:466 length:399 start_codon:yes stop_codon:yes gene_type:complete
MQFPQEYKLDPHNTHDAILSVIELNKDINVDAFKRFFFITSKQSCERGNHAHKHCSQILFALSGQIEVCVKNSEKVFNFTLKPHRNFLFIPTMWWASQQYAEKSILGVLCNETFSEGDYVRDWNEFLTLLRS